jgi:hypothetical protein
MENEFVQLRVNYIAAHIEKKQKLVAMAELVFVYEKPTYEVVSLESEMEVVKTPKLGRFATAVTAKQLDVIIENLERVRESVRSLDDAVGTLSGETKSVKEAPSQDA